MTQSFQPATRNTAGILFVIVMAGVGVRAWLLFSTPWMPGINGAYYLVQARALLERGALGIPDMPLVFHLHAGLAWLLSTVFAFAPDNAIILAVKCCDALLPPLAALPVFALTRRWAIHLGKPCATVPLAAAALAVLSFPLMGMVGEFQKNSLGLFWLASFIAALHAWLERHEARSGIWLLVCVALLGLTHIGVLGSALLLTGLVVLFWFVFGGRLQRETIIWSAGGAGVLVLSVLLVLWRFDPQRVYRLMGAATDPAGFASAAPMPVPPSSGMFALIQNLPFVLFAVVVTPSLWIVWKRRRQIRAADAAVVAGSAVTALVLTGPWFSFDKAIRFQLIALIPAILAGGFALLNVTIRWWRNFVVFAALLMMVGPTLPKLLRGGHPSLSNAALIELSSLRPLISAPEHTLVSAQHGVEWWTAWLLRTRIAHGGVLKTDDWKKFQSVYFLEVTEGFQMPDFTRGALPGGPRPFLPPQVLPNATQPNAKRPGIMAMPIPVDATIVHSGMHLKLALVPVAPSSINANP